MFRLDVGGTGRYCDGLSRRSFLTLGFAGGHRMLTAKDMGVSGANNNQRFPGIGAIVARQLGPRRRGMPAYVGVPSAASIGLNPGYFGGHFLGAQYNPFQPGGDPSAPN